MRKIIFLSIALFMFNFANAQRNVIKVNPLAMAFGSISFSYETLISDKGAIEVSAAYTSLGVSVGSNADAKASGFGLGVGYKAYFSKTKDAPRGWYAEPNLGYSSVTTTANESDGSVSLFNLGALGGYQWIFGGGDSGFALDLGLGFNYINGSSSGDVSGLTLSGIIPAGKVSIGYGF